MMKKKRTDREVHRSQRSPWLRAMVLGANDGIVSTACLLLGVLAAGEGGDAALVAGLAGLVAGALSMAVGELVSVGSQHDAEEGDIDLERREHATMPALELEELVQIYIRKGLSPELARQVAVELTAKDALKTHLAEELGITPESRARPVQAAVTSALAFAAGAAWPLVAVVLAPVDVGSAVVIIVSMVALAALGAAGARLGGAPLTRAVLRVVLGGGAAMALTMGIGALVGRGLA